MTITAFYPAPTGGTLVRPPLETLPPLAWPQEVEDALRVYTGTLAISISSGVDSQALLWTLAARWRDGNYPGRLVALIDDLGRMDWPETIPLAQRHAAAAGVDLYVLGRSDGKDLLDVIDARAATIAASDNPDRPFWPSKNERYCTSDCKRGPSDWLLRRLGPVVVSAEGIRADESDTRAEKEPLAFRNLTAKTLTRFPIADALAYRSGKQRVALTWYPLHEWDKDAAFRACGHSLAELEQRRELYKAGRKAEAFAGWQCARSYVRGAKRHSCAICVLGDTATILAGARENPPLFWDLHEREQTSGWTFKPRWSLDSIAHLVPPRPAADAAA